jgi:Uma2 family endonuclease
MAVRTVKLGTDEVWLVVPNRETVTGYIRGEHEYSSFAVACRDETFTSPLLSGLSFSIPSLWMPRR